MPGGLTERVYFSSLVIMGNRTMDMSTNKGIKETF